MRLLLLLATLGACTRAPHADERITAEYHEQRDAATARLFEIAASRLDEYAKMRAAEAAFVAL